MCERESVSVCFFFLHLLVAVRFKKKKKSFGLFYGFIESTAEDMTGKRGRKTGSDTQQRDPHQESNPGPL